MRRNILKTLAGGVALAAVVGLGGFVQSAHAQKPEFVLKIHDFVPMVATTNAKLLKPWTKKIEKESHGRIKFEIYPSMQLGGKPSDLIQQVKDGVVDIVWTLPGYTPGRYITHEAFELPFMATEPYATNMALQDYMKKNGQEYKDVHVLMFHAHAGQVFHSRKAIHTAADIKGLKIRTPTRTGAWMIEAMGAIPIGAPVPKIPEMLSKGIVDAVLIPYEISLPLKVDQLVHYQMTFDDPMYPRINTSVFLLAMNKAKYDSMPKDLQKIIDKNSGRHLAKIAAKIWINAEKPGRAAAKKEGGHLYKMPPAEVAKIKKEVIGPVYKRWIAEADKRGLNGQKLVDEARALIAKYTKK